LDAEFVDTYQLPAYFVVGGGSSTSSITSGEGLGIGCGVTFVVLVIVYVLAVLNRRKRRRIAVNNTSFRELGSTDLNASSLFSSVISNR